jgi:hypothetical protein
VPDLPVGSGVVTELLTQAREATERGDAVAARGLYSRAVGWPVDAGKAPVCNRVARQGALHGAEEVVRTSDRDRPRRKSTSAILGGKPPESWAFCPA